MPASAEILDNTGVDYGTARCVLLVEGKNLGPKSYVNKITLQAGEHAGIATAIVPLAALDDNFIPAISGVRSSPIEGIQRGDIAVCQGQLVPQLNGVEQVSDATLTCFAGTVQGIHRDIKTDTATITVKDHRHKLEGIPIVGSFWANISGDNPVSYCQGIKPHFNPNNQPNCIFVNVETDYGTQSVPMFCAPFYNHSDFKVSQGADFAETSFVTMTIPIPGSAQSFISSCYWTPAYMWQYFWYATSESARQVAQATGKFPEFASIFTASAGWLTFPPGLETTFADNTLQSRKAFERNYHCYKLSAVLSDLCSALGPFALDMLYEDDGGNILTVVRSRYKGSGEQANSDTPSVDASAGYSLIRAVGGDATDDMTEPSIVGGYISEDGDNLYEVNSVVGARPATELRWATARDDGSLEDKYAPLLFAFSNETLLSAEDAIEQNYNRFTGQRNLKGEMVYGRSPSKFLPAIFAEFDCCASFICDPQFDFQTDTQQDGYPVAAIGRAPLPQLISSLIPSGASDEFARQNNRFEISVETNDSDDDVSWLEVKNHGIEITGDGVISFRNFRDAEASQGRETGAFYIIEKTTNSDPGSRRITLLPNRVRITLAIPSDHRLTAAVACASIAGIPIGAIDTDDSARINFNNGYRTRAVDTGNLHAAAERSIIYPPYPIPQSRSYPDPNDDSKFLHYPAAGSDVPNESSEKSVELYGNATILIDDTAYAVNHANRGLRDFGRLDRSGELVSDRLDLMAAPGDMIDTIQNTDGSDFPIKAVVSKVIHDFKAQTTKRQLV